MSSAPAIKSAVSRLRVLLGRVDQDAMVKDIVSAKDEVLDRYGPIFSRENIPDLSKDVFKSFLRFKDNNKHWTGLQRMGPAICSDMPRLRQALSILLDEDRPIEKRLDTLLPWNGKSFVPRLGKAVLTGILHVAHPNKYGVYNGTSEAGMKHLEVWPSFDRGEPFGKRYVAVNEVLHQLAKELNVDLWTLDSLWWLGKRLDSDNGDNADGETVATDDEETGGQLFGLERHLHNFMFDNWSRISLANEWDLYEEDGEVGYEFNADQGGRIDLLARHKTEPRWLVIELKRNQSSDKTIGQVTRYMGWVQENLATKGDTVHGLIIAREVEARLRYALKFTKHVDVMCYKVDFQLYSVSDESGGA